MGSNRFGKCFEITTWGESHGKGLGVVIDGCPPNLEISEDEINRELRLRRPGQNPYTSPRGEKDEAAIYSGVFEGKTTGAPICIVIHNADADSSKYEPIKDLYRPGHANFTYLKKYGIFDYRGGGRSSARETAARVAAGALARKVIPDIEICAYVKEIAGVEATFIDHSNLRKLKETTCESPIFCPDQKAAEQMMTKIREAKDAGDSVGGIIECVVKNAPVGLGDPVYDKLEANLAKAMLSIPATKGFEIGSGFAAARMKGSEHNDLFINDAGSIRTKTNHGGGTLGGISDGMPLVFRVAFKPTSSIEIPQETVNTKGEKATFKLPQGSRHDPCVAVRAAPIVEAMTLITLADAVLANRQLPQS